MRQYITGIQYTDAKEAIIGWGAVLEDDSGGFSASIDSWGYVISENLRKKLDNQHFFVAIGTTKQDAIDKLRVILSNIFETEARVDEIPLGV